MGFSQDELTFVRNGIAKGCRADLRKSKEERKTCVTHASIAQSDGNVRVKRGWSEIEVSIQFKETQETLGASNISEEILNVKEQHAESIEFSKIAIPDIIISKILELLDSYKIGIRIELNILSNDGNIYDLFFIGLGTLLKSLDVPIIDDLKRTEKREIDIPISRTVALFNNGHFVVDPTMIEEEASCGLMHIFVSNEGKLMGCLSEGNCDIEKGSFINIIREISI
ncbi:hypothetical protein KMI_09g15440 [Encephalitozoon hellem]|nr:hypothetical protein KMI_09g15440 [Encephalitozoon hellem]